MSVTVEPGRLLVDGEWVEPGGGHYDVINPSTEQVIGQAPEASEQQALDAAASAARLFTAGRGPRPAHRAEILERVADLLVKRGEEIIPLLQAETGATMRVASTMQVPVAVDRFRRYARDAMLPDTVPLAALADARHAAGSWRPHRCGCGSAAGRRCRLHHAVQLPAGQPGRQDRSGPGHG